MKKDELTLGAWVDTPQGYGKIKELREDRAYLRIGREKTNKSFAYKDLKGILLTPEFIENNLHIKDHPTTSQVKNINRKSYIILEEIDCLYVLWEGHYTKKNDLHWNLGIVLLDTSNSSENGMLRTFAWGVSYLHQLQMLTKSLGDKYFLLNIKL